MPCPVPYSYSDAFVAHQPLHPVPLDAPAVDFALLVHSLLPVAVACVASAASACVACVASADVGFAVVEPAGGELQGH